MSVVALAAPTVGLPWPGRAAGEADRGESGDRLGLLTALVDGPGFDPVFRGDVIQVPGGHAVFPWHCVVLGCRRPRWARQDLCAIHTAGWRTARAAGMSKSSFVHTAALLELGQTLEAVRCRVCPGRPAFKPGFGPVSSAPQQVAGPPAHARQGQAQQQRWRRG